MRHNSLFIALEGEIEVVPTVAVAVPVEPVVAPCISDFDLAQQQSALEAFTIANNELAATIALEGELIALRISLQGAVALEVFDETNAALFNVSLITLQREAGIRPMHSVSLEAALLSSSSSSAESALVIMQNAVKKIWKAIADGIRHLVKMAEAIWVNLINRAGFIKKKTEDLKKEVKAARLTSSIKNHPPFTNEQLWTRLAIGESLPKSIAEATKSYSDFMKNLENHQFHFDLSDIERRMQAAGSDPTKNVTDDFKLPDMSVPGMKEVPGNPKHNTEAAVHYVESDVFFGNRFVACWLPNKGLVGNDAINALRATSANVGIRSVNTSSSNDFAVPVASLEDCDEILNSVGDWCDKLIAGARDKTYVAFLRQVDSFFRKVEEDGWIQEVDSKATPHLIADTRALGNLLQGVMSAAKTVTKATYSNGINLSSTLCQYAEKSIAVHKA